MMVFKDMVYCKWVRNSCKNNISTKVEGSRELNKYMVYCEWVINSVQIIYEQRRKVLEN